MCPQQAEYLARQRFDSSQHSFAPCRKSFRVVGGTLHKIVRLSPFSNDATGESWSENTSEKFNAEWVSQKGELVETTRTTASFSERLDSCRIVGSEKFNTESSLRISIVLSSVLCSVRVCASRSRAAPLFRLFRTSKITESVDLRSDRTCARTVTQRPPRRPNQICQTYRLV